MSDATHPERHRRSPNGVNWLVVALCPLVFWLLRGDTGSLIAGLVLIAIFGAAAQMLISALEDEEIGDLRGHRYPRKMVGSVLIGLGVTLLALIQTNLGLLAPAVGFIGFALSVVAFGVDQGVTLKRRVGKKASKSTHKLVDTTERVLAAIPLRVSEIDDEPSILQAKAFRDTVMDMLERNADLIDEIAPELHHVVSEAAQATDQFVEDYLEGPEPRIKRRYMVLLRDLAEALNMCIAELRGDVPGSDEADAHDSFGSKRAA